MRRSGLTLIELLTVIAIIGILVAVLIPAVQMAREAARRAVCSNQLKQQILALQLYHQTSRSYPYGATGGWGFDWRTHLLPYLEQAALAETVPWGEAGQWNGKDAKSQAMIVLARFPLPSMRCGSQQAGTWEPRSINGIAGRAISSYSGNSGGDVTVDTVEDNRTDMRKGNGPLKAISMLRPGATAIRADQIIDGLSQTVLVAEVRYRVDETCGICDRYSLYHPNLDSEEGTDYSETLASMRYAINDMGSQNRQELSFGSFHPAGCNVGYADGSIRFVSDKIHLKTWQAQGSIRSQD